MVSSSCDINNRLWISAHRGITLSFSPLKKKTSNYLRERERERESKHGGEVEEEKLKETLL